MAGMQDAPILFVAQPVGVRRVRQPVEPGARFPACCRTTRLARRYRHDGRPADRARRAACHGAGRRGRADRPARPRGRAAVAAGCCFCSCRRNDHPPAGQPGRYGEKWPAAGRAQQPANRPVAARAQRGAKPIRPGAAPVAARHHAGERGHRARRPARGCTRAKPRGASHAGRAQSGAQAGRRRRCAQRLGPLARPHRRGHHRNHRLARPAGRYGRAAVPHCAARPVVAGNGSQPTAGERHSGGRRSGGARTAGARGGAGQVHRAERGAERADSRARQPIRRSASGRRGAGALEPADASRGVACAARRGDADQWPRCRAHGDETGLSHRAGYRGRSSE